MVKLPSVVRRASWNLVDQIISSVTNAALSFVVARSVDDATFGGFAVAFTVFAVLVGLSRALSTSPLLIRFSSVPAEEFSRASAAALGTAFMLGVVSGAGSIGIGLLFGGVAGQALIALGMILPGLLVQDAWRQVFFAQGRPAAAALNDAVWAVVQFAAVAALLITDMGTVGPLVLAWGGAAVAAALLGIRQGRTVPRPAHARGWVRDHRDLTGYVVAEFSAQQGAMQGALLAIAAVASLAAIGAVRGTQVLLGVTNILLMAAVSFALPEFSRRRATLTERQWILAAIGLSTFVGGLGFLWGLLFILGPDALGGALLGDTWDGVSEILLAAVISQLVLSAAVGPSTMLRAMDRAPVTFGMHTIQSPLVFVGGVGGVIIGGAEGAFWGFTIAYSLVAPFWWIRLRREAAAIIARGGEPLPARQRGGRHRLTREMRKAGVTGFSAVRLEAHRAAEAHGRPEDLSAPPTMPIPRIVPPPAPPPPVTPPRPRPRPRPRPAPEPGATAPAPSAPVAHAAAPPGPVAPADAPPGPVEPAPAPPGPAPAAAPPPGNGAEAPARAGGAPTPPPVGGMTPDDYADAGRNRGRGS